MQNAPALDKIQIQVNDLAQKSTNLSSFIAALREAGKREEPPTKKVIVGAGYVPRSVDPPDDGKKQPPGDGKKQLGLANDMFIEAAMRARLIMKQLREENLISLPPLPYQ